MKSLNDAKEALEDMSMRLDKCIKEEGSYQPFDADEEDSYTL